MKCTQYEICVQAAFKNARVVFFFLIGRDGQQLSVGVKKIGWATRALRSLSSHDGAVTRLAQAAQMA
jgi:hypothetical protein